MEALTDKKRDILQVATEIASEIGLEALSIGKVSERAGMSKSGLFAHFKSKENLQIQVLEYVTDRFQEEIFGAVLKETRGVARLIKLSSCWENWVKSAYAGGCPMFAAVMEYDDHPGLVRTHLKRLFSQLYQSLEYMATQAQELGEFSERIDVKQFGFEYVGLMLGYHMSLRMMDETAAGIRFSASIASLIEHSR